MNVCDKSRTPLTQTPNGTKKWFQLLGGVEMADSKWLKNGVTGNQILFKLPGGLS